MENIIGSPAIVTFDKYNATDAVVNITSPTRKLMISVVRCLDKGFTYQDPKKKHSWEFKQGYVHDCNERSFDKKTQTLAIGLIPKAVKYLKKIKLPIKIEVSKSIRDIYSKAGGDISIDEIREYAESLNIYNEEEDKVLIPYEHQIDICYKILNGRRISTLACTSAGKSLSMYIMSRYMMEHEKKKLLIVTPSKALVVQLFDNFVRDYGWKEASKYCTLIHGESKDKLTATQKKKLKELDLGEDAMLKDITISTWQSLQKQPKEFFRCFRAVMVDEAHSTRGVVLRDILSKCMNAIDFKVGLSGTLPDEGLDAAWIEGSLGRREIIIKLWELIELGLAPPMEICGIKIPYNSKRRGFICRQRYQDEYFMVTNNGSRKKVFDLLLDNQITTKQNSLVLYKNKGTLDEMHKYLLEKHPNYTYHIIKGEINTKKREEIKATLEKSTGNIIIATYGTMKQGVSIKLLHNLVFAEFSKSMYEIVQGMGRLARLHPLKPIARVFDIYDDASYTTKPREGNLPKINKNYSVLHYETRNKFYVEEKIPITEFSLEGIYEADINTDALAEKKEAALKKAAAKKTRKKPVRKKLGNKSQFF